MANKTTKGPRRVPKSVLAAKRKLVPSELIDLYLSLGEESRQYMLGEMERRKLHEGWQEKRRELEASGKMRRVSFSVAPESFRLLEAFADNHDCHEGTIAAQIFRWAFPVVAAAGEPRKLERIWDRTGQVYGSDDELLAGLLPLGDPRRRIVVFGRQRAATGSRP